MGVMDKLTEVADKVLPTRNKIPAPLAGSGSGGVGSGHGMFQEDDMIVSKPTIIFHTCQIFFNFLAMACFASVASFQGKWHIGPSGLSGFALFVTISGVALSLFMLLIPVIYEKYDKMARLARALKEIRVGFILSGAGVAFSLLIAFIVTISAWTQPGCKDPAKDPHEGLGDDFKKELPGWCNTKKAAGIFLWLAFLFWMGTLVLVILDWRSGAHTRPRDPPFTHPAEPADDADEGDEESQYHVVPRVRRTTSDEEPPNPFADTNRYSAASSAPSAGGYSGVSTNAPSSAPRPSMDAYGAFSDPAPTGYGDATPRISRTMQYADPYAAVRATIESHPVAPSKPPTYESYQGYR